MGVQFVPQIALAETSSRLRYTLFCSESASSDALSVRGLCLLVSGICFSPVTVPVAILSLTAPGLCPLPLGTDGSLLTITWPLITGIWSLASGLTAAWSLFTDPLAPAF